VDLVEVDVVSPETAQLRREITDDVLRTLTRELDLEDQRLQI
jgi:hypothetical protein